MESDVPLSRGGSRTCCFLRLSFDSGMLVAQIKGFLAREEAEVREKAKEMGHSA
jgi:hypothetical protein